MNALLYGAVFAVSGGVPKTTTTLLAAIAGGQAFWLPNPFISRSPRWRWFHLS